MDIWDEKKRSLIMSKVPQKDTKPEIVVRKYLFSKGLRYRKNVKCLPGSPDIVLPKYKAVVFVNGCFWHGHDCRAGKKPGSNMSYWDRKITENIERDKKKIIQITELGWNVLVVWQCELKNKKSRDERLRMLVDQIIPRK